MNESCGIAARVALGLLALGVQAVIAAPQAYTPAPERPGDYRAYERHADYVAVADGTRLAVTWYLPSQGPAAARFPVLLWYMPGHRESIDPRTGALHPGMDLEELAFFTAHGYAVAIAEMRGSGASFGFRVVDRGPQIGLDGRDLVNWVAAQPWSSGTVGMIGVSYQGFSQFATASHAPPALKAIFPEIAGFDDYTSLYYPGGILNVALARVAYAAMGRDDRNEFDPAATPPRLPSAPVVDEDGDGMLANDLPVYRDGSILAGPPTYADGKARADVYWNATREHLQNGVLTNENVTGARYRDSPLAPGISYQDLDPATKPDRIAAAGIAVYNRGGWFDYHARDTTQWFGTLFGHTPDRLLMAPTGHTGLPSARSKAQGHGNAYLTYFGDERTTGELILGEKLRFFDRYLLGLRNGIEAEPPVLIYVMGRGWRREAQWPLQRARSLRLALAGQGRLVEGAVAAGHDAWQADAAASSLSAGANRWNYGIAAAAQPMSLDASLPHRLAYTSAPLTADREITGHPQVELTLTASDDTVDVYAYLEDVAPDGSALLVTEGQLRANYHRLRPAQGLLGAGSTLRVKPALPWHGYTRADFDPAPFAKDRAVHLKFDLMPTAWLFAAGHSIRLSVASADQGSFEPSPGRARGDARHGAPAAVWQLQRGKDSVLILPWIP